MLVQLWAANGMFAVDHPVQAQESFQPRAAVLLFGIRFDLQVLNNDHHNIVLRAIQVTVSTSNLEPNPLDV